ncbi:PPOX class F420-dependent oxidoreductase [Ornithinicoccus halotolerans]|uniref:PPOX class F420-dependent oxidoreductase n=1 Tax=Ornithinicoccus halotolerans TaxID=1748220 RepID=UPI001294D4C1|nr:PPOX class F420-dependent oxidoreductase [Ornithinicoccus halotolerans]
MDPQRISDEHHDFLAARSQGTLVTIRRNGRPQLSNVLYEYHRDAGTARVSVTADRAKTHNAAREPWVALHVSTEDFWGYLVAEGRAELSAVAADPHDEVVDQLVDYYRRLSGEHPDWDEYRQAQVDQGRLVMTVTVERTYGAPRV